jgi:hypothetical protein
MSRLSVRTLLAIVAVALVAAVPAIAVAHKGGGKSHSSHPSSAKTVGTVASFTDGVLVVSSGGLPVSGRVTYRTKLKWADRGHRRGWFKRGHMSGRYRDHGTGGGMPTAGGMPTGGGLPPLTSMPRPTLADLQPGAVLRKAQLKLTPRGPVWTELKLVRPAVTPAS